MRNPQTPILILLLLLSPSLLSAENDTPSPKFTKTTKAPRIFGGDAVPSPSPYPWVVSLTFECPGEGEGFCGGSLIEDDTVLTAAHCFDFSCGNKIQGKVSIGLNREDPIKTLKMRAYAIHPDYDDDELENDVAVWFLDGKFDIESYAKMADEEIDVGTSVKAVGWGYDEDDDFPERLREVTLEVQPASTCRSIFGSFDDETQLCAGVDGGGKDTCQGDSGGPLFRGDRTVYGITSFGTECGTAEGAGYALVSEYRPWVEAVIEAYRKGDIDSDSGGNVVGMVVGGWVLVVGVLFWQF